MLTFAVLVQLALWGTCAVAHGFVNEIGIDDRWYVGSRPGGSGQGAYSGFVSFCLILTIFSASSPIRAISDNGPVQLKGSDPPDFLCGKSSQKASLVAPASPGSRVAISWSAGDGTSAVCAFLGLHFFFHSLTYVLLHQWFHRVGPLMTYMTPCGSTPCDQFEPTMQTEWFKIAQYGQLPNDTHTWYQTRIAGAYVVVDCNFDPLSPDIPDAKATYTFKLPENLASGGYLVRHEVSPV